MYYDLVGPSEAVRSSIIKCVLKARILCEIFLSDYFMKHSLMYISLHLCKICKKETSTIKKKGIQKKPESCNFIKKETGASVFL